MPKVGDIAYLHQPIGECGTIELIGEITEITARFATILVGGTKTSSARVYIPWDELQKTEGGWDIPSPVCHE